LCREFVFDEPHARAFVEARVTFLREMLPRWKAELDLHTALDVGCGVGYFAALLHDLCLDVTAVEGRAETADEARHRVPGLKVQVGDVEEISSFGFASFDFVLALGLLYHLENPFRVIRQLRNLTRKLLVIESMCARDSRPILCLRDEEHGEDQSLGYVAFYPSEMCLVKMLYCAGFPFVYRFRKLPDHPDFSARLGKHRVRTMLAASMQPLPELYFAQAKEPATVSDPWISTFGRTCCQLVRLGRFAVKPWSEKIATLRRRFGTSDAREY
jgi:SAM-dependent methyltransferase